MHTRLARAYRLLAYLTGVFLLLLTAAVVVRLITGDERYSAVVAPIHGWLYFVYFVVAFALSYRERWALPRTLFVMAAGTIPLLSFVAERRVRVWLTRTRPLVQVE